MVSIVFWFLPRSLGRWSNLTSIFFQRDWFNHQLVLDEFGLFLLLAIFWNICFGLILGCCPNPVTTATRRLSFLVGHPKTHSLVIGILGRGSITQSFPIPSDVHSRATYRTYTPKVTPTLLVKDSWFNGQAGFLGPIIPFLHSLATPSKKQNNEFINVILSELFWVFGHNIQVQTSHPTYN